MNKNDPRTEYDATALETLKIFYKVSLEFKKDVLLSCLNPLSSILTYVALPYFASLCVGSIATQNGQFGTNIIWLIICSIFAVAFNWIGFLAILRLLAKGMARMTEMSFSALIDRGAQFHSNNIGGKIVSHGIDMADAYNTFVAPLFNNISSILLSTSIGLIVVYTRSVEIGLFLTLIILVLGVWIYFDNKHRSNARKQRHIATKNAIGHFSDAIVNAVTVKTFANEETEKNKNIQLNQKLLSLRVIDWEWAGKNGSKMVALLLSSVIGILLILNATTNTSNLDKSVSTGLFAFTYAFTMIVRLFVLTTLTRQIEESMLKAKPMTHILSERAEIIDTKDASELLLHNGAVELNEVSFEYIEDKTSERVFSNLNLSIKPGEKVGLIGPSGGGKTTFTRLLLRFDDIQSGIITIDGQNIAEVTQHSLRSNIGYVPQEPLLFHRSVRENIAYGKLDATDAEIRQAAKAAHALEFIESLPKGFDTIVGERGIKLSGGQRQRVAIARAMLKNAPILLLDEATSALDSESEQLVQSSLDTLMKHKTAIVIAHRLSTIQKMDRIIVLDDGKIVEQGNHTELLKNKKGLYTRLWKHQSGGFLKD